MKRKGMDKVREALAELVAATDPDGDTPVEGWKAAWRKARAALSEQPAEPVAFVDEHVETFVSQYNDVYCDQRKAGVSGGDAERKAMKEVLILALGAAQPAPSEPAGWQPIETAPKDVRVLLWSDLVSRLAFIGKWGDYDIYNQPRITHWMPLPAAPRPPAKGGES